MFDSPYPPMPQRGEPSTSTAPPDQQYSQSRTHDQRALPRRATTGLVPPHVLAARRNASGPVPSSSGGRHRNLVFHGQPIDVAAAKAGAKGGGGSGGAYSSDEDPISAEILDNASVPMFVPPRLSSLANAAAAAAAAAASGQQALSYYPSSRYMPHQGYPSFAGYQARGDLAPGPSTPRNLAVEPPCPGPPFTGQPPYGNPSPRPSPPHHPSLAGSSPPLPAIMGDPSTGHRSSGSASSGNPYHEHTPPARPAPAPSSPLATHFSASAPPLPTAPSTPTSHKGQPESPPRFPIEFPKAATAFAAAIQEAEHRLHNSDPGDAKEDTDPEGEAHFKLLEGMFDEIKGLSICAEKDSGRGFGPRWSLSSVSAARQRLPVLKDVPAAVAPERSRRNSNSGGSSPVLATFARARKDSISAGEKTRKRSGSGVWKRGAAATTTTAAEVRFPLEEEVGRARKDFAMVDFVWGLKSSCPVAKNVTQYGEWERMAGEDGRGGDSVLNQPKP